MGVCTSAIWHAVRRGRLSQINEVKNVPSFHIGVTADQLIGVEKVKKNGRVQDSRLWRRFSQVEKLPLAKRKQIVQILDAFLESEKLKKSA